MWAANIFLGRVAGLPVSVQRQGACNVFFSAAAKAGS